MVLALFPRMPVVVAAMDERTVFHFAGPQPNQLVGTVVPESALQFGGVHFQSRDIGDAGLASTWEAKHRIIFGFEMRVGVVAEHMRRKPVAELVPHLQLINNSACLSPFA